MRMLQEIAEGLFGLVVWPLIGAFAGFWWSAAGKVGWVWLLFIAVGIFLGLRSMVLAILRAMEAVRETPNTATP